MEEITRMEGIVFFEIVARSQSSISGITGSLFGVESFSEEMKIKIVAAPLGLDP